MIRDFFGTGYILYPELCYDTHYVGTALLLGSIAWFVCYPGLFYITQYYTCRGLMLSSFLFSRPFLFSFSYDSPPPPSPFFLFFSDS